MLSWFKKNKLPEHAVIVSFDYGSTDLGLLFQLESEIETAIAECGTGEYDGNEIAVDGSDGFLYMYGPKADALFKSIEPVLRSTKHVHNIRATLRFGPPADGVKQTNIVIS